MSSDEDGDFLPSAEEEEDDVLNRHSSEDGDSSSEEGGDDDDQGFFDDTMDPLEFLEGMEHNDQAFELLRHRRHHQSEADDEEDDDDDEEEEDEDEDAMDEDHNDAMPSTSTAPQRQTNRTKTTQPSSSSQQQTTTRPSSSRERQLNTTTTTTNATTINNTKNNAIGNYNDDDDDLMGHPEVKDTWNDALAERLGLAPVLNRRKARNREKWRRRSAKRGTRRKDMPEEAARKLGEANLLYATQRYPEATALLMDVVRLAPTYPDAYTSLGLLYETLGNNKKALNFYMFAAHLAPKDVDQWKRLWQLSIDAGLVRQAIYALTEVIKREREDWEYRMERALLYAELGDYRKAIQGIEQVRAVRPENPDAAKHLTRLYYRNGAYDKAEEVLSAFIESYPEATDLTHINLLAELMCSPGIEKWQGVLDILEYTHKNILPAEEEMPLELSIKGAMAKAHLGQMEEALEGMQPLLQQDVDTFNDVFLFVATGLDELKEYDAAEPFYKALAINSVHGTPAMWHKLVECRTKGFLKHYNEQHPPSQEQQEVMNGDDDDAIMIERGAEEQQGQDGSGGSDGNDSIAATEQQEIEEEPPLSPEVAAELAKSTVEIWKDIADHVQPGHPHYVEALLGLADALRMSGDEATAATILGRLDPSFVQSETDGNVPMTAVVETEAELLQRANVLKACGRLDLMVDLALPSIAATLTSWQSAESAAEARRIVVQRQRRSEGSSVFASMAAATAGRYDDDDDGMNQGGGDDAVFVGYVSDQRRRQRRRAAAKAARDIARRAAMDAEAERREGGGDDGDAGADAMMDDDRHAGDDDDGDDYGGRRGRSRRNSNIEHSAIEARLGGVILRAPTIPGLLKDEQAFHLMIDTVLGLLRAHRSDEALQIAQTAIDILGKRFPNKKKRDTMRLLASEGYLEHGDVVNALKHLKGPAVRWPAAASVWNLLCKVQLMVGGLRHSVKFLGPLRQKNPGSLPLALMSGHAHVHAAAYGIALSEYFQAYRAASKEPLVLLCIAAALLNVASSKYAPDRNATVLQAFGFLAEYGRLRCEPSEVAFNMGRAAHQLELMSLAVSLYEQALVLSCDESGDENGNGGNNNITNTSNNNSGMMMGMLHPVRGDGSGDTTNDDTTNDNDSSKYHVGPEAAFNLSLILRTSGATALAKDVLRTHLTF